MSRDESSYVGGPVVAIWHREVARAVHAVLELPADQLAGFKIRSGEHLAAILITAFLGVAPSEVDTHGDVDLRFVLPESARFALLPSLKKMAAFEIKSMPGPFREFDHKIDIANIDGDARGMSLDVKVETANDILASARPLLEKAQTSLLRKTRYEESRNVFLVVHPFDRVAIEIYESPVIAAALAPLDMDADTVWVLWVPDHLTVWSRETRVWTDLIFTATRQDEPTPADSLSVLQNAESEFMIGAGIDRGSPYLFGLSGGTADE